MANYERENNSKDLIYIRDVPVWRIQGSLSAAYFLTKTKIFSLNKRVTKDLLAAIWWCNTLARTCAAQSYKTSIFFYGVKGIISLLVLVLHQLIKSTHYIFIPSWICMSLFEFCAKKSRRTFGMFSFISNSPVVYIHTHLSPSYKHIAVTDTILYTGIGRYSQEVSAKPLIN